MADDDNITVLEPLVADDFERMRVLFQDQELRAVKRRLSLCAYPAQGGGADIDNRALLILDNFRREIERRCRSLLDNRENENG